MDNDTHYRPVDGFGQTSPFAWTSWIILGLSVLAGLFVVSRFNYLLFHTLVEMFSIAVAWSVFMLVWNARDFLKNDALLNLGTAYLFIGFVDLLHTLAFLGMGVFAEHWGANLPTQLWIAARYMEAAALLTFVLLLGQRVRLALPLAGWGGVAALLLLAIFAWRIFPDCFVDGVGLTPFKIGSEYLICLILLTAMALLRQRRKLIDPSVYRLMLASMLITIFAELAFTLYADVYGLFNQLGHYFKLISFLLIYLALIQSGLRMPFALLFRALDEERTALRRSENLFKKVFEILPIGLWIADKNGKLMQGNPAGVAIWGAEPNVDQKEYGVFKARRLPSGEEIAHDDWALAHTVNKGETIVNELLEIDAFDGKKKTILNYTAPILDSSGLLEGAIVVNQDITERVELEKKRQQIVKAESLTIMAGAIAHHFNNMLSIVIGNLELALTDSNQILMDGEKPSDCLNEAMEGARRAAEMSAFILAYTGQLPQKMEVHDLWEVTEGIIADLKETMPSGIRLVTDPSASANLPVKVAPDLVRQALTYLITNAREAIEDEEGEIQVSVITVQGMDIATTSIWPPDWKPAAEEYAAIQVNDTGCGIKAEDLGKVMDPFFSTKFTGRGIGLPVVLGIAQAHQGAVTVESESGVGSTFQVLFPLAAQEIIPARDKIIEPAAALETGCRILLVEDEEMVRNMVATILRRLGFDVLIARDGMEALDVFRSRSDEIRLVITDLTMPRMNGWETLAALREIRPGILVILASGHDEARIMSFNYAEQPHAYLHKPFGMNTLRKTLERVLRFDRLNAA